MADPLYSMYDNGEEAPQRDGFESLYLEPEQNTLAEHPSMKFLRTPRPLATKQQPDGYNNHPAAAYLESLTRTLLSLVTNGKDATHPLVAKHISPDFRSNQDDRPPASDRSQHTAIWLKDMSRMPDMHCEVISCTAKVHEDGRKAKVWTLKRLSNLPGGICKEGVSITKWERKGQVWMCVKLKMLRGVAEYG